MRRASRETLDREYAEFVAARQIHLRRIAYAVCGDWDRAEDLLQTALTKLYVASDLHRHREESHLAGVGQAPVGPVGPGASRAGQPRQAVSPDRSA